MIKLNKKTFAMNTEVWNLYENLTQRLLEQYLDIVLK